MFPGKPPSFLLSAKPEKDTRRFYPVYSTICWQNAFAKNCRSSKQIGLTLVLWLPRQSQLGSRENGVRGRGFLFCVPQVRPTEARSVFSASLCTWLFPSKSLGSTMQTTTLSYSGCTKEDTSIHDSCPLSLGAPVSWPQDHIFLSHCTFVELSCSPSLPLQTRKDGYHRTVHLRQQNVTRELHILPKPQLETKPSKSASFPLAEIIVVTKYHHTSQLPNIPSRNNLSNLTFGGISHFSVSWATVRTRRVTDSHQWGSSNCPSTRTEHQ